jgi:hypothetical protein
MVAYFTPVEHSFAEFHASLYVYLSQIHAVQLSQTHRDCLRLFCQISEK